MTLEEQVRKHVKVWDCYNDEPLEYNHTGKLLKIINEFTIGFAEWAIAKNMGVNKFTLYEGELEIYKKEKGL